MSEILDTFARLLRKGTKIQFPIGLDECDQARRMLEEQGRQFSEHRVSGAKHRWFVVAAVNAPELAGGLASVQQ